MSLTNTVLRRTVGTYRALGTSDLLSVRPRIVCKDGFSVSLQAGRGFHCTPDDDYGPYTHVELGYPAYPDRLMLKLFKTVGIPISELSILPYAVNKHRLQSTIYKQVPVANVDALFEEHGGLIGFEVYEDDIPKGCTCEQEAKGGVLCLYCRAAEII